MGEKRKISTGVIILIIVLIVALTSVTTILIYKELNNRQNEKINNNDTINQLNTIANNEEKDKTILELRKQIEELKKNNSEEKSLESTKKYEISTLKNIYDVISDSDTEITKAQKIAREVEKAVNNEDWYYLAKLIGSGADHFIQYGIYDYEINYDTCEKISEGKYLFMESYSWDKSKLSSIKDVSLGRMLIIKFEAGGKIEIYANCTGT